MKMSKLWIGMLLLLTGCQQEVTDSMPDGALVPIEIKVSGMEEAMPDTRALTDGMRFRLMAYQGIVAPEHLKGWADYMYSTSTGAITPVSTGLSLASGTYTFMAYSFNTATALTGTPESMVSVSYARESDFLTCIRENVVISAHSTLELRFRRMTSRMKIVLTSSELLSKCKGEIKDYPTTCEWTLGADVVTPVGTGATQSIPLTFSDGIGEEEGPTATVDLPAGGAEADLTFLLKTATVGKYVYADRATTLSQELMPGHVYTCKIDLTRENVLLGATADTRANCYIVSRAGGYSLNATVKGNGKVVALPATYQGTASQVPEDNITTIDASDIASAEVLWETANTRTAPAKGDIVDIVDVSGGMVTFVAGTVEGNAVIAVKNSAGTILWSWHIWRTNKEPVGVPLKEIKATDGTVLAAEGALKLMDRNLGALSNVPYIINMVKGNFTAGLLYQWGRKDPLPGTAVISDSKLMATTPSGIPVVPPMGQRTVQQSVEQPATFVYAPDRDWCSSRNDNLWGCPVATTTTVNNGEKDYTYNANPGAKTIYDPCPAGWRMAPGYVFANLNETSHPWTTYGRELVEFTSLSSGFFFFPASGTYDTYSPKALKLVGSNGYYWTASPDSERGSTLIITKDYGISTQNYYRVNPCAVRCIKE